MVKNIIAVAIFCFSLVQVDAQIGVMKLVGKNTNQYRIGFGAFLKAGIPVSEGVDATIEIGANFFPEKQSENFDLGTIMCPLKIGYRYTLDGSGKGFYVEPQAGYNLYGGTSLLDKNSNVVDLSYHGVVLAAGTGYLFSIWELPLDLNLRYETTIAHGGSNNLISLGISRGISFRRRDRY